MRLGNFASVGACCIFLAFTFACKPAEQNKWVGKYDGAVKVLAPSAEKVDHAVTLELRADSTFSEVHTSPGGTLSIDGIWKVEADQLSTTPSKVWINGSEVPKELSKTMYKSVPMKLEGDSIVLRDSKTETTFSRKT